MIIQPKPLSLAKPSTKASKLQQEKSPAANAPSDGFSRAEQRELDGWTWRLRTDMGKLTTPPAGPVEDEMAAARDYLIDVLDRVAGPDITESGIDLKVELFSGNVANAALDDSMSREDSWKRNNEDKEWPIRQWMEIPEGSDGKPIYRLTINTGMLNGLETEDEIAFVLAHQAERLLDHVKRDPDNEETLSPPNKSFVDSREMQAAADKAAIGRMADAGYNPRAAFNAISTIYALNPIEYPENDLERALTAAAHDHEAEGMRVSGIQSEVEDFVRRGEAVTELPMKPIPQEMKVQTRPYYNKPVEDMEAFKANHNSLAEELATDTTPEWMFDPWGTSTPREHFLIQQAGGDQFDKEEALLSATEHLESLQNKTPQQKVDGFLRLVLSLRHSSFPEEGFSPEGLSKMHRFLSTNGQSWDSETFFNTLKSDDRNLNFTFVYDLFYKKNFQDIADNALPGLTDSALKGYLTRNADAPQPKLLPSIIRHNHKDDRETWPMAPEMDKSILDYLKTVDVTPMTEKIADSGLTEAGEFANDLFGVEEPNADFKAKIREAGEQVAQVAGESRENRARIRLQVPIQEPKKLDKFLENFGQTEDWKNFGFRFEHQLTRQLKDVMTIATTQPGFLSTDSDETMLSTHLERRVVELAERAKPEDRKNFLTFLTRHLYPTRRVRTNSPRREWLTEAARMMTNKGVVNFIEQLENPDNSQHSQYMTDSLTKAFLLKDGDLTDTSTASLKKLDERVRAGEFEPKREDYQSDHAHNQAMQEYRQRRRELRSEMEPVHTIQSRQVLSALAVVGHDSEISHELAQELTLDKFTRLLESGEAAKERYKVSTALADPNSDEDEENVGADAGGFLVDGFLSVQDNVKELETWYDQMERTLDFSDGGLQARVGAKRSIGKNLFKRLTGMEEKPMREWLRKEKSLQLMSAEQSSDLLLECLGDDCAPGTDPSALAARVKEIEQDYKLIDEHPIVYLEFRDKVAEKALLQPSTVDTVFPEVVRGVTDTNQVYRDHARSLSGLVAIAREKSPVEQLETIEYLMGRQDDMPAYLDAASEDQAFAPLRQTLENTREDLLEADSHTRVMIANSFLAGPSGVLRTDEGKEAVINHFLKNLEEDNRELGEKIAHGVLYSHGKADTLAVAYILAQHPEESQDGQQKGKLDEAKILNRLFDAYGVPGVKMKQYLAFTSEFKDFKEAFEDAQDSSRPLNYYQVLKLVQNRFGDEWPEDLAIDRVLGSGSVNVAIRYRNTKTGQREVVSLGRQDIEESTQYDFDRFNLLIEHMTRTPEDKEKFGYVLGLLDLINDSVALEFKKDQAMAVQQKAYQTYRHLNNGWIVKSIDAYSVENLGLFMEEAKGKTARKIFNRDVDTYNDAMKAMASVEFEVLRGVEAGGNWSPRPLFANPDFHDGQVLIDKDDKTVTILDFGQAVPISNEERVGGLDFLTIIGKVDSPKAAAKRLNKRYFEGESVMTTEDLEPIMEREDRMDCFIHLLSKLNRSGAKVPISTIHWVLGINRQMALGEKIGHPIDDSIRNMLLNHKSGLPLSTYNAGAGSDSKKIRMVKQANTTAKKVAATMANSVGLFFDSEPLTVDKDDKAAKTEPKKEAKYKAWRPNFR